MTLTKLSHGIVLAWGWRRILIAFLAGAATTLALPPFEIWPIAFLTFPVLVWLIDGAGAGHLGGVIDGRDHRLVVRFRIFRRRALLDRQCVSGRCQELRMADAVRDPWATGLSGVLSRARAGARAADLDAGRDAVLALAFALMLAEWLRGHLLTGFPWNAYGYALMSPLVLAQGAALIGLWGMTFVAVAVFASPAALADDRADTAPSLAGAGAECRGPRRAGDLRLGSACARADQLRRQRPATHHAAESAAGREIQLCPEAAGDEPLPGAVRADDRARVRPGCAMSPI